MKRLLKLLARLYPPAWRNRYGAEFDAVLEDTEPRSRDIVDISWAALKTHLTSRNFIRIVLPCSIAGALIAIAISFATPPRYISQSTFIAIELHGPSNRGAREVTEDEAKRALSNWRDSILDRDFLASTIQKFDLYPHERAHIPLDKIIDKMQRAVEIKRAPVTQPGVPGSRSGFIVNFAYSEPHLAQRVEGHLAFRMLTETVRRAKSASGGLSQPHESFVFMEMPSLPQKPAGWNRSQKTAAGIIAGLLCGIILAAILGPRHDTTVATG